MQKRYQQIPPNANPSLTIVNIEIIFIAYDELWDSNIFVLPSCRTLRDYKNAITPTAIFNSEIMKELMEMAKH